MKISELKQLIREALEDKVKECPAPTQDLELNTANRNRGIQAEFIKYGPLNLADEAYWVEYAKKWGTKPEVAKKSNCSNCVAFDISPRMEACMPGSTDEDGRLGYCWMHHFKCHSARTCYTWAAGGPIGNMEEDELSPEQEKEANDASYNWQKRNLKGALSTEPIS
jgi:hypothetical protein